MASGHTWTDREQATRSWKAAGAVVSVTSLSRRIARDSLLERLEHVVQWCKDAGFCVVEVQDLFEFCSCRDDGTLMTRLVELTETFKEPQTIVERLCDEGFEPYLALSKLMSAWRERGLMIVLDVPASLLVSAWVDSSRRSNAERSRLVTSLVNFLRLFSSSVRLVDTEAFFPTGPVEQEDSASEGARGRSKRGEVNEETLEMGMLLRLFLSQTDQVVLWSPPRLLSSTEADAATHYALQFPLLHVQHRLAAARFGSAACSGGIQFPSQVLQWNSHSVAYWWASASSEERLALLHTIDEDDGSFDCDTVALPPWLCRKLVQALLSSEALLVLLHLEDIASLHWRGEVQDFGTGVLDSLLDNTTCIQGDVRQLIASAGRIV